MFLEGKLVVGCLWLQCVLRVIKCHQDSKHQCEPITIELMHIIFQSVNFYNHTMLGLPAVSGFLDSHTLLSSPSTPTLIMTSTLLSAMSKQSP